MAKQEKTVTHGIIDVVETTIEVGGTDWNERLRNLESPERWKSHFPHMEWLQRQHDIAAKKNNNSRFRPNEDWGWYVETMIANLELLGRCVDNGDTINAVIYAAELASLATESNIKFQWERFALSGKKSAEGAASTRIAEDGERRDVVNKILASEAPITKAQAFIRAEQLHPELGTESSYRRSYYLKTGI